MNDEKNGVESPSMIETGGGRGGSSSSTSSTLLVGFLVCRRQSKVCARTIISLQYEKVKSLLEKLRVLY